MLARIAKNCGRAASRSGSVRTMSTSMWADVPMGPADPIIGVTEAFTKDTDERKLNLGVGAYRDETGKPWVLPSVREASKRILEKDLNHEYAPIAGLKNFVDHGVTMAYGEDSLALKEGRIAALQALSGTGACRLAAEFISKFAPKGKKPVVFQPNPTWGNHVPIMVDAGLEVRTYRYYDPKTGGVDIQGMMEDLKSAPEGSVILLHVCAHNPTGADPSLQEWAELADVCVAKNHFALMDSAYQGFASGSPEQDALPLRIFESKGVTLGVAQSFAKNFGLYGHRIGTFSLTCASAEEARRVESQLKIIARPMYSNPPVQGARIVSEIMEDDALKQMWYDNVKTMADRIIGMRTALKSALEAVGSTEDWGHITSQIGMFCFSGLTPEQVDLLVNEHHVYLTRNGRISMAGVTPDNVEYLASAMHKVRSA